MTTDAPPITRNCPVHNLPRTLPLPGYLGCFACAASLSKVRQQEQRIQARPQPIPELRRRHRPPLATLGVRSSAKGPLPILVLNWSLYSDWGSPSYARLRFHRRTRMLVLIPSEGRERDARRATPQRTGEATIGLARLFTRYRIPHVRGRLPQILFLDGNVLAVGPLPREGETLERRRNA